jgi:hypothetical protein
MSDIDVEASARQAVELGQTIPDMPPVTGVLPSVSSLPLENCLEITLTTLS